MLAEGAPDWTSAPSSTSSRLVHIKPSSYTVPSSLQTCYLRRSISVVLGCTVSAVSAVSAISFLDPATALSLRARQRISRAVLAGILPWTHDSHSECQHGTIITTDELASELQRHPMTASKEKIRVEAAPG